MTDKCFTEQDIKDAYDAGFDGDQKALVDVLTRHSAPRRLTLDITCCARCGEDHPMSAAPLAVPLSGYTHVGMCRKTARPVMVKFIETEEAE